MTASKTKRIKVSNKPGASASNGDILCDIQIQDLPSRSTGLMDTQASTPPRASTTLVQRPQTLSFKDFNTESSNSSDFNDSSDDLTFDDNV